MTVLGIAVVVAIVIVYSTYIVIVDRRRNARNAEYDAQRDARRAAPSEQPAS